MMKKKLPYEVTLVEVIKLSPEDVIATSNTGTNSPFDPEGDMDDAWT